MYNLSYNEETVNVETKSKIYFISANKINIVKDYIKLMIIKLIMIIIKTWLMKWKNETKLFLKRKYISVSLNFNQKSRRGYKLREISET